MTLKETIQAIEWAAIQQPSINMIVRNDIFRLNSCQYARYGVFGWTQQQHTEEEDLITFNFNFFYVDRLNEDKSNEIDIQSVGIQTLSNIIRLLEGKGIYTESWQYQTFNQRFHDECAGVYATVALQADVNSVCSEAFPDLHILDDFSYDFNKDFDN